MSSTSNNNHESSTKQLSRWQFVAQSSSFLIGIVPCNAFEGGVGGLGKTKPDTGVVFYGESAPSQNEKGIVSAELNVNGNPVLVEFTTPWPLLPTTSGLEARDLQSSESAFVQVLPSFSGDRRQFPQLVMETILGSRGKFGAYGAPTDVKIRQVEEEEDARLYLATFTAYTPGMRESPRSMYLRVGSDPRVVLVTGTTRARFQSQQETLKQVADSLVAIPAPKSQRKNASNNS